MPRQLRGLVGALAIALGGVLVLPALAQVMIQSGQILLRGGVTLTDVADAVTGTGTSGQYARWNSATNLTSDVHLLQDAAGNPKTDQAFLSSAGAGGQCTHYDLAGTDTISVSASNQVHCLGIGTYTLTTTLLIGNGTTTAFSTINNVEIRGVTLPGNTMLHGSTFTAPTILDCTGGLTSGIELRGVMTAWKLSNFRLRTGPTSPCARGLFLHSASHGLAEHLHIDGFHQDADGLFGGLAFYVNGSCSGGCSGNFDTVNNHFRDIVITELTSANSRGIVIYSDVANANVDFNVFERIFISTGDIGLDISWSDNNYFSFFFFGPTFVGGGPTACIRLLGSNPIRGPESTTFIHIDCQNEAITSTFGETAQYQNYMYHLSSANGQTCPDVAGLIVYGCYTLDVHPQFVKQNAVLFANLGTPPNGTMVYCSNCDPATLVDQTCTSAGTQTGNFAVRLNGAWKCVH